MLSEQQEEIIKKIAKRQLNSLIRCSKHKFYEQLIQEFKEEGYDVKDTDFLAYFAEQAELWDSLMDDPKGFLKYLDQPNASIFKTLLLEEFCNDPECREIWRKLNLMDDTKLNERLNNRN